MLQPGQPVEIRLDAYPQAVFGTFSATVLSVSGVALLPTEIDVPLMIPGPVFEVRAALDDDQIEYANANWSLQPGISFQADIVQQRLRLYEWLLRSVTRQSNRRA
jgi:membrane fusion protein